MIGALPGAASNQKLPDPFTKIDGTRITARSEWRCRRQEILKLAESSSYGTKPPKPDSVTGTVTDSSITLSLSHQGQTTSFSVGVELPSTGSRPYPALVSLGTGMFGFSHNSLVKGEGAQSPSSATGNLAEWRDWTTPTLA